MSIRLPGASGDSRVDLLPDDAVVRFAGVTMDLRAGQLRRGEAVLPLRPKSFNVLAYFVRHRGRLIPRLEVMKAVWPDVIVTDDSLVQCLVEIRRVFGDQDPITTVRGRGHRFDAPVVVALTEPERPLSHATSRPALPRRAHLRHQWQPRVRQPVGGGDGWSLQVW